MSIREADLENDTFRMQFEAALKGEGAELDTADQLLAWDFFKHGWEAAVRCLNDDDEKRAAFVVPEGYVVAPIEPSIEMVMAGEESFENQAFVRLDHMKNQAWPSEQFAELGARVAYRAMLAASSKETGASLQETQGIQHEPR